MATLKDDPEKANFPMRAIRAKCLECSAGSIAEVRICQVFDCPLWRFRLGKRPATVASKNPDILDPDKVREMANAQIAN